MKLNAERWRQIEALYHAAADLDPTARAEFLERSCPADLELREEVAALLAAQDDHSPFMADPAMETLARLIADDRGDPADLIDRQIASYRIVAFLGEGGMGEVYKAHDARLDRPVALKFLLEFSGENGLAIDRFVREAKSAAALDHPFICKIYEVGEADGKPFIAMEYVSGQTLEERLREGPLELAATIEAGREIAEALQAAHRQHIVHRDLKPSNIMIDREGHVKVMDFGLAKRLDTPEEADESSVSSPAARRAPGTPAYMSPEQVLGGPVAPASDVFSLGVVLYEMMARQRPAEGATIAALTNEISRNHPLSAATDCAALIAGTLDQNPAARPTAGELRDRLRALERSLRTDTGSSDIRSPDRGTAPFRRRSIRWLAVAVTSAAVVASTWALAEQWRRRWMRTRTLPVITSLIEAGDFYEGYRLARRAQTQFPQDEHLRQALSRITRPFSLETDPPGAEVFVKSYSNSNTSWDLLGKTPLEEVPIPIAVMRWRVVKAGFEPFEGAPFGSVSLRALGNLRLDPAGARPAGMVRVPGGRLLRANIPPVDLPEFWIDRFEVTNREYKGFIAAGGYEAPKYWGELLADANGTSFEEASARFRDATARPGPSTWQRGEYPEGLDDHPVGGISWYEAAAYCAYAGKRLPTVSHWYKAFGPEQLSDVIDVSNFGEGPVGVGSLGGLGAFGTYDMAGNVREWAWNSSGTLRYSLGGAWGDAKHAAENLDARPPFERSPTNGVRCARYEGDAAEALAAIPLPSPELLFRAKPARDDVFAAYRSMYAYDRAELNAVVESVDDRSPTWRKEVVSFDAAYSGERVTALLFLPRNVPRPYQAVIWFPGDDVFFHRSRDHLASQFLFDFIPASGRALIYPIYRGMYERAAPFRWDMRTQWRDRLIFWSRDLGRTLDYLETRADIDRRKLAYYGFSSGAWYGPVFQAVDSRFAASILLGAGICLVDAVNQVLIPPEMNAVNFAPRVRVPTLMINGRRDLIWSVELSQRPLFDLLGSSSGDKRHVVLDGGHIPSDRRGMIREILGWLDKHLGPPGGPP